MLSKVKLAPESRCAGVVEQVVPPWALLLLCLSKRVHSIFLLRLFNDGPAMLLAHAGAAALLSRRPRLAVLLFSAATSVKMNILLMAPSVLVVLLKARCWMSIGPSSLRRCFREACIAC